MHLMTKNYVLKAIYNDENEYINDTLSHIYSFAWDEMPENYSLSHHKMGFHPA